VIKKKTPPQDQAMDVDPPTVSNSLETTQSCPLDPEIEVLNKEDRIKDLVKTHVANWKRCVEAQNLGATEEVRTLLSLVQESQKALQELIPRKEVENYVKGWNPWKVKRQLFSAPRVEKKRGKKESTYSRQTKYFNNPSKWDKVVRMCSAIDALYQRVD